MLNSAEILFSEVSSNTGAVGLITLDRPQALNALNYGMIVDMYNQLHEWANNAAIKAVIIQGSGEKAFCAGGDIRKIYEARQTQDPLLAQFFWHEYRLNRFIHNYPKPYIALLNGVTMGGGAGISIPGSLRIATEKLMFAMPETGIGFFPDVGGSYFLSHCPGQTGIFLGLTGTRIKAADAIYLGLADQFVLTEKLPQVIDALVNTDLDHIAPFTSDPGSPTLSDVRQDIDACFGFDSVEEIIAALEKKNNAWSLGVINMLTSKSPTSLKVTLQQLRRGAKLNFDQCLQMEYRLTMRFLLAHDLKEGVRAVIIDKDQNPKWQPAKLSDVSQAAVDAYFAPLVDQKELQF